MKKSALYLMVLGLCLLAVVGCSSAAPAEESAAAEAPAAEQAAAPAAAEATGDGAYHEAPMLAEMVAAGELPPVEERLPADPLVVTPLNEVGVYGGEQRGAAFGPRTGQLDTEALRMQSLLFIEPDLVSLSPNILAGYEASADKKTWTLTLRSGMKWSDG
ncbi:MAG TPA: hypothetical protein P5121_17510, partial [Caldilineaceae bacterium]|nr:hypothetical protein [Caldilineaceae bacterium]